jgi:hypothetical protein
MLTIGKLGSSPDQLGYYEQQVAQGLEDYFSGRGEAPGRWTGRGALLVRATGDVDRAAFMRAMAGCDPRTGEQLKPPHGRARVAAFDLTFSAPKCVSVLFATADEDTSAALLAAAYRHRLSRAGDPQLHTHVHGPAQHIRGAARPRRDRRRVWAGCLRHRHS